MDRVAVTAIAGHLACHMDTFIIGTSNQVISPELLSFCLLFLLCRRLRYHPFILASPYLQCTQCELFHNGYYRRNTSLWKRVFFGSTSSSVDNFVIPFISFCGSSLVCMLVSRTALTFLHFLFHVQVRLSTFKVVQW